MAGATRAAMVWFSIVAIAVLGGCSRIPADPDGTLGRVQSGVLRVGVSPHEPWTVVGEGAEPTGIEPDLVRSFAAGLQARVEWRVGGEEPLINELHHGRLDLVVGGFTADTPWSDKVAITKPYAEGPDPVGKMQPRVMAASMGENAFLLQLERFLLLEADR